MMILTNILRVMKMNKYRCYYLIESRPGKLFSFDLNANTKFGAIIKATRICKRPLLQWTYLTVIKKEGKK